MVVWSLHLHNGSEGSSFIFDSAFMAHKGLPSSSIQLSWHTRTYLHLGYSIVLTEHVLGTSHPWLQGHSSILGQRICVTKDIAGGPFSRRLGITASSHPWRCSNLEHPCSSRGDALIRCIVFQVFFSCSTLGQLFIQPIKNH